MYLYAHIHTFLCILPAGLKTANVRVLIAANVTGTDCSLLPNNSEFLLSQDLRQFLHFNVLNMNNQAFAFQKTLTFGTETEQQL